MGPCRWDFPDPAGIQGELVGRGADLEPATLVRAYRHGIFPWPHAGMTLPWFSPEPRAVVFTGTLHRSRSLLRRLRTCGWTATVDQAFAAVVAGCADRPDGTWIRPEMAEAYTRLHRRGWAHSVEVWDGGRLVGGVYGVQLGGIFTGESMFHRATDASKVALAELDARLAAAGAFALDVQLPTDHLESMGAVAVARAEFLKLLFAQRDRDIRLPLARLPVRRLAEA